MEWVGKSELPNHKGGSRYFLLSSGPPPFPYTGKTLLSSNGKQLVEDFRDSMGECLGGGLFKSKDLENYAKTRPACIQVHAQVKAMLAQVPTRQAMAMANQLQAEWIAFEYTLVLCQPLYGLNIPIPWERLLFLRASKKVLGGDMVISLTYAQPNGEQRQLSIQANGQGMGTLYAIASTVGVPTQLGK